MSMIRCSCCGEFRETDGEGQWNVPRINSTKTLDFVCGVCEEKYITEDGQFDRNLEEKETILEQWEGGEIGLIEAFETLTDLGHDPVSACDMLKARSPHEYEKQDMQFNAEMAGMA